MSVALVWTVPPTVLGARVAALGPILRNGLRRVLAEHAVIGEGEMKTNAPWRNRTGAARAGLFGTSDDDSITLGHGVDYGIYLELKNQGRYAIVRPTLESLGPRVITGLGGLL